VKLSEELEMLSIRAAKAVGLDYTGVDIIESERGPMILEVNGTPFWAGVNTATGENMAEKIIDFTLSRLKERGRR
jgi:glutathione synthase/RimK-type ligase-like ATP-grasp enzyme